MFKNKNENFVTVIRNDNFRDNYGRSKLLFYARTNSAYVNAILLTTRVNFRFSDKRLVVFLDDLNMPEKEVYGAQPPLELIRQWIDYGFWYDQHNQSLKHVKNMRLIAAMGPPGGGRNAISNRLTSCFSVINMTFPEEPQISTIYNSMLNQHLKPFDDHIRGLSELSLRLRTTMLFIIAGNKIVSLLLSVSLENGLTNMTVSLYKSVVANLLPTPAKMHYQFNLRDISKVRRKRLKPFTFKRVETICTVVVTRL